MSDNDTTFASTISKTNSASGLIHVPAAAQRSERICIDDTVEVTLSGIEADPYIDTVSFEGRQCAGDSITVPADLMRRVGFEGGDSVIAQFERMADDESDSDDDSGSLADSKGSVGSNDESDSDDLDDVLDDALGDDGDDLDEEDEEGLGKLFE